MTAATPSTAPSSSGSSLGAPRNFATGIAKTVDWYLANRGWAAEITSKKYARERLGTKS